jgi:hypothetical protein
MVIYTRPHYIFKNSIHTREYLKSQIQSLMSSELLISYMYINYLMISIHNKTVSYFNSESCNIHLVQSIQTVDVSAQSTLAQDVASV